MNKEIAYRLFRITLVTVFFFIMLTLTTDARANYDDSMDIYHSLINSLQISDITNKNQTQSLLKEDKMTYDLKITNSSSISKPFTIALQDNPHNTIDYKYINYQIIKDDEVLATGKITSNKIYTGLVTKNKTETYKVQFWIDDEDLEAVNGKRFLSSINII